MHMLWWSSHDFPVTLVMCIVLYIVSRPQVSELQWLVFR
jgi:hypothetical protein